MADEKVPRFQLAAKGEKRGVREDFWWVYENLGGRKALLCWAEENAKEFFKIFFQLLSKDREERGGEEDFLRALRELAESEREVSN
ncbi:MAG: hypothetical protein C0608_10830 [Deltaproteobacteria bacterium]|nr:MAG: hypothetical protein C0608_10830 [Deltaproteobacteria bacterium]